MVARLTLISIALMMTWPIAAAHCQSPNVASNILDTETISRVSPLVSGGKPSLAVTYPWRVHPKPSVEVRLVTGDAPGKEDVRPMFFRREYLKGQFLIDIYHCQDKAAGIENSMVRTEDEIEFEIIGKRNSLGAATATVLRRIDPDEGAPGVTAIFTDLAPSAMDKQLLYLDLPPDDFAQPGKLVVWFLREGTIVWTETLAWPGLNRPAAVAVP